MREAPGEIAHTGAAGAPKEENDLETGLPGRDSERNFDQEGKF